MRSLTMGATCALLATLLCACGDDTTGGDGGGGGGTTATTTTGATTTTTTVTTTTTTGSAGDGGAGGGTGGSPGTGGEGGQGGEAPACASVEAVDLQPGGPLDLRGALDAPLGDPDVPDVVLVGYELEEGDFDLTSAINDNFATCEQCVLVLEDVDAEGAPARIYYPSAGTMEVVEAAEGFPYVVVSLADVELVEVTIDEDGISTPVDGGECLSLADVTADFGLPDGWTCNPQYFADGQGCDCACGAYDPDCSDPGQAVIGCGPSSPEQPAECTAEGTCAPPVAWTCPEEQYGDGAACHCDCGAGDPDCLFAPPPPGEPPPEPLPVVGCDADESCNAQGECFALPASWTCNPAFYGTSDGCDCNCGAYDPDCDIPGAVVYGCGPGGACTAEGTCGIPAAWMCEDAAWDDGVTCDCECGASDPDCADPALPTPACADGESCTLGQCVTPASNDTCDTALPLVEGTVEGTWIGATHHYSPGAAGASCTGYPAMGIDVAYAVSLTAGQTITVEIGPTPADASIYLVTDCAAAADTCVAGADATVVNAAETLEYTAAADGSFFLIVDQYAGAQQVPFTLTVTITP